MIVTLAVSIVDRPKVLTLLIKFISVIKINFDLMFDSFRCNIC